MQGRFCEAPFCYRRAEPAASQQKRHYIRDDVRSCSFDGLTAGKSPAKLSEKGLERLRFFLLTLREPRRNYDQNWIGTVWIRPHDRRS